MIPPTSVLRADVQVGVAPGLPLVTIAKGTAAQDIDPDQLAQLCLDHFVSIA